MKAAPRSRRLAARVSAVALLVLPAACAIDGGYGYGYGPRVTVGVGLDYYESSGFDYGGWGDGYNVGPPRPGMHRGGGLPRRGFRSAPEGRAMPSLPAAPRRGGNRR